MVASVKNCFIGDSMIDKKELHKLHLMFNTCGPVFIALGDGCRQQLLLDIADAGVDGINVTNLASKSSLSRPAISHHLKVLKDCGLIKPFKTGTQIFYKISMSENLDKVSALIASIQDVLGKLSTIDAAVC